MGTFWADISQYQRPVDDSYPHRVFSCRSNTGDKVDTNIKANLDWAIKALDSDRLDVVIVYYFFRPGQANCDLWRTAVTRGGKIHPKIVCLIDVEGDNGSVSGDRSSEINDEFERVAGWLGDRKRVIGYQNPLADPGLWRTKPAAIKMIIPSYTYTPGQLNAAVPVADRNRMIGHQYSDKVACSPFGPCDANFSPLPLEQFLEQLGITKGDDMAAGDDVKLQFLGDAKDSLGKNSGWKGLAPQPDEKGVRWSAFLNKAVDRLSVVEALGTLIFEATLRIAPTRARAKETAKETVLGHAAAAHGTALDIDTKVDALTKAVADLTALVAKSK